jgi:hypothetical protein
VGAASGRDNLVWTMPRARRKGHGGAPSGEIQPEKDRRRIGLSLQANGLRVELFGVSRREKADVSTQNREPAAFPIMVFRTIGTAGPHI